MSWTQRSKRVGKYMRSRWVCDCCRRPFNLEERVPKHFCKETVEHPRLKKCWVFNMAGNANSSYSRRRYDSLHYCSDECLEPYLASMIEEKLIDSGTLRTRNDTMPGALHE